MKEYKNKLVIIGNGFDLAHGLKTSYQDFLNWYLNDVWEKAKINGIFSDDLINIKIRRTHIHLYTNEKFNIELFINRGGQEVFYIPGDSSKILKIEYNSVLLEKLLNVVRDYRWVDIEMEYYNLLVSSFLDDRIINGDLESVKRLNSDFNFIKDKLEEYLKTLDDFSTIEEIQKLFKDSFGSFHWESNYREIHYLNFNYTNTVEKYIPKDYCKYELNYIHGKLNDKDNPLIFGYGDEVDSNYEKIENLNNNLFLNNFKSFGYFKTENYSKLLRFVDSDLFGVEIIGHSCGLSDRVLLNTIFEHDKCASIKIHYHQKSKTENDFLSKTQEISRHFKDKAKMRKRIVNFKDCKPLVKFRK